MITRQTGFSLLKKSGLVAVGFVAAMFLSDEIIRATLLEPVVPMTEQQFDKRVVSWWPRRVPIKKAPGTFRVVGLSDSTGCAGIHDNYHFILEKLLRAKHPGLDLVNLSRGGLEISDELLFFKRFGPRYAPDMVLHGFFVGNDFEMPSGVFVQAHEIVMRDHGRLGSLLPHRSLLVQFLSRSWIARRDLSQNQSRGGDHGGTFSPETFLRIEQARLAVNRKDAFTARRLQQVMPNLDLLRQEIASAGATHVMVIFPDQLQVELGLQRQLQQRYGLDLKRDYDLNQPQRTLLEYCAAHKIRCLDLLGAFRQAGAGGGLYLPRDTHLNEAGNQLAAAQIQKFLAPLLAGGAR